MVCDSYIVAYNDEGCSDTASVRIEVTAEETIFIPNAFTPNKDQINDIYKPHVDGVREYEFYIYSREGQEIFYTNDINIGWDGYVDAGKHYALSGKYAYSINIIDIHGKKRNYYGNFLLIR